MAIVPNKADPAAKVDLNMNSIRKPVSIASGATKSSPIYVGGQMIVGLYTGPAITGATVSFESSHDGGVTFSAVENEDGTLFSLTVEASRLVAINPPLVGLDIVKVVSASAEAADRNLVLVLAP